MVSGTSSGSLTGPGAFVKNGSADLTLSGAGSFGGAFTANAGRLILQSAVSGTGFPANSGGTLRFDGTAVGFNAGVILANAGGAVEYNNATISNGFLRGHPVLVGGHDLILEPLVVAGSLGLEEERALAFQALGALPTVLRVAVLADRLAATPGANVDDGGRKHPRTSTLPEALATVRFSLPPPSDAQDLVQGFLSISEANTLSHADREKGRLRAFLLGSLQYFLTNEHDRAKTLRRGGGQYIVSVDAHFREAEAATPASRRRYRRLTGSLTNNHHARPDQG